MTGEVAEKYEGRRVRHYLLDTIHGVNLVLVELAVLGVMKK